MKQINFLTVLAILQVFHLGFSLHIQPIIGINKTADVIYSKILKGKE